MLLLIISILYGLLFLSDCAVITYPLRKYINGDLNAGSFNTQKKITFYSRSINFLILPLAGLTVDLQPDLATMSKLVVMMIFSSVISLLLCLLYFKNKSTKLKFYSYSDLNFWNLFYCFHYIGLPCVIYFAINYHEYRATIMQLSTMINFISNYVIVWKIDRAVSELIDNEYTRDDAMQYLMSLLFLRLISKTILLIIAIWYVL